MRYLLVLMGLLCSLLVAAHAQNATPDTVQNKFVIVDSEFVEESLADTVRIMGYHPDSEYYVPDTTELDTTEAYFSKPRLSFVYKNIMLSGKPSSMFGANFEIFISKYFSFNYSILAGDYNGKSIMQTTPGVEVAGWYFQETKDIRDQYNEDGDGESLIGSYAIGALLALIPQGFNIYVPLTTNDQLVLSLNPMSCYYYDNKVSWGVDVDLRINFEFPKSHTFITPFVGFSNIDKMNVTPVHFGVMLGIRM